MTISDVYVANVVDVSGSMRGLTDQAQQDYDQFVREIQPSNDEQHVYVSLYEFGGNTPTKVVYSRVKWSELTEYLYRGYGPSTPLRDGVGRALSDLKNIDDTQRAQNNGNSTSAFLVTVITDGGENDSHVWSRSAIQDLIRELNSRDNWTITMRIPRGNRNHIKRDFNLPDGNILEWNTTRQGLSEATTQQATATRSYMSDIASGTKKKSSGFYADTANLSKQAVSQALQDISHQVTFYDVAVDSAIRPFIEQKTGSAMIKGAGFYQLTKVEDVVQPYKVIAIREVSTGKVYAGSAARAMLGLPEHSNIRVRPSDHSEYEVFIQSTSINRNLKAGSRLMYWPWFANPSAGPVATIQPPTSAVKPKTTTPVIVYTYQDGFTDGARAATAGHRCVVSIAKNEYGRGYIDGFESVGAAHSTEYQRGYRDGFPDGKSRADCSKIFGTPDYVTGYNQGYKDGKNKKKRLYK